MHAYYKDIIDRIADPPLWFDDYGVPRYEPFAPNRLSNIYRHEAAFAEISCQHCERRFHVAISCQDSVSLSDAIRLNRVNYGDPPNVECCGQGPNMSSVVHRILEYWVRDNEVSLEWCRDPRFEGLVGQEQLDPPDVAAEAIDGLASGIKTMRIRCTSRANRYDLAGRIASAMVADSRILIASSFYEGGWLSWMLRGRVPETIVGDARETRQVTLVRFEDVQTVDLQRIDLIIFLACTTRNHAFLNEIWKNVVAYLAATAASKTLMEFGLHHSVFMVEQPELVIGSF